VGFQHNIKREHLHAFQDARCFEKLRLDRHGLIGFENVSRKLQALTGFNHYLHSGFTLS
jgi:phenylalanine-4-hydroxylase